MHALENGPIETAFASDWGSRLVAFYFLLCANQSLAEELAIETLSEVVRSKTLNVDAVARQAMVKAASMPANTEKEDDVIALGVELLPQPQNFILALSRGLGLSLDQIAKATQITSAQAKQQFADGLIQLGKFLRDAR